MDDSNLFVDLNYAQVEFKNELMGFRFENSQLLILITNSTQQTNPSVIEFQKFSFAKNNTGVSNLDGRTLKNGILSLEILTRYHYFECHHYVPK